MKKLTHYRSWVEIDRQAIRHNIQLMRSYLHTDCAFMLMLKANAYGHGMVEVAKIGMSEHATYLGLAYPEEIAAMQNAGITGPFFLLAQPADRDIVWLVKSAVTFSILELPFARRLAQIAKKLGKKTKVHIKIDTGLHRLGFMSNEAVQAIQTIHALPEIEIEGIYTHFSDATDPTDPITSKQLTRLLRIIKELENLGIEIRFRHAANSAGVVWHKSTHLDMARFGMAAYGLQPSDDIPYPLPIKQALTWKAVIMQVKQVGIGERVGYGHTWQADKPSKIATISVGYADGVRRAPYAYPYVLCQGVQCPIIGRVAMSNTIIDVSNCPKPVTGSEVVLIGHQSNACITPEEIAQQVGTSNEEIITAIGQHIPRIYI